MYRNFVGLLIFVLFSCPISARQWRLWPSLAAVDLGAVIHCNAVRGAKSPGKWGAGTEGSILLSKLGISLWAHDPSAGGVGTWLCVGFQAEFMVLALTFGPNSNLFGISGRTLHVLQLILGQVQQPWNSFSVWETPSLLWGCCLIVREELHIS